MAVSGKTASPHELPYYLPADAPPDMAAVTKALAEKAHARLNAVALSQLVAGAENNGKLVIVNSGAAAYTAMKGDATLAADGTLTISTGAVGSNEVIDGSLLDTDLASPNNAIPKTLFSARGDLIGLSTATTYLLGSRSATAAPIASGVEVNLGEASNRFQMPPLFPFKAAKYAWAGKTTNLNLLAQYQGNGTKPASKFDVSLFPITGAGGAGSLKFTVGAAAGPPLVFTEPEANQAIEKEASFAVVADGIYVLGLVVTGAMAANSAAAITAHLRVMNV